MENESEKAVHLDEKYGFNTILSHVTDIISLVDKSGFYLYNSPAVENVLGYPVEFFIGKSCFDMVHPEDQNILQANFHEHVINGVNFPLIVYRFKHINGSWRYLEVSSTNKLEDEALQALVVVSRDVTERIEAEKAYRESEVRFKNLIEASEDLVWQTDVAMNFTYISPGIYSLLGLHDDDTSALSLKSYIKASFKAIYKNNEIENAVVACKPFSNVEHTFVNEEGQLIYMESTGVPLFGKENSFAGYSGVSRVITERVLQQNLLSRREQQYRCLFEHNVDAVYSVAPDGTFSSVNHVTAAVTGYSQEELEGMNFEQLIHPACLEETKQYFLLALAGNPQHYKTCVINRSGSTLHAHVANIPIIINNEVTGVFGIAKDITAQVKAEESLRNSEEFFRAIFESSSRGVLIVNVDDGLIVEANKSACQLFGRSYAELRFMQLDSLEKPGGNSELSIIELCKQQETYRGEHAFEKADGDIILAEISIFRFRNAGGQHLYGITIQDVTERHRQEQEQNLLAHISKTFTESDLLEDALLKVLESICHFLQADLAEAWIPRFTNDRIDLRAVWTNPAKNHEAYFEYIKSLNIVKGGPVTCIAWEKKIIDWVEDIDEVPELLLRNRYKKEGFRTYVSMPIIFRDEVVAVLKVFSTKNIIRKEINDFINQLMHHLAPEIQRKKTAEELNRFFELSPDMLCMISMNNGRFLKSNKATQYILGYNSEELNSLTYHDLLHPDDLAHFAGELGKLQREESITYIENRCLCKDGTYKWLAWTGKPFGEEKIVYAVAKHIDQIKKANEEIRRSAIKLNNMVESISDGFYTLDKDWTYTYINKQFENVTPYKIAHLLGKNIWELHPGMLENGFYENYQKAIATQQTQHFEAYCEEAGFWYEATAYPSEEGLSVYIRNITETRVLESMMLAERKVLEMNASSKAKLPQVLNYFLSSIEELYKGMTCAVVMLNEHKTQLQCLSAPGIPQQYRKQVKLIEIGKGKHSLSTLYDPKYTHVVTDIQSSALWSPYRTMLKELDMQAFWSFPIEASNNRVLATLIIFNQSNREPSAAELHLIERVSNIIGLLIEKQQAEQALKKSHAALRKLTSYVQNAREQELKHLAREIHDELGQVLTALKIDITLLYRKIADSATAPDLEEVREKVAEIMEVVNESIASVRKIVRDLRPVVLDDLGLISEIEARAQEFSKRMNIEVELLTQVDKLHLGQDKATEVFRILQETLTNISRHAKASKVRILITYKERNQLLFEVEDNGKGFIISQKDKQSYGLLGMHERALMIGGELTIKSVPGKGTKVLLTVPDNN